MYGFFWLLLHIKFFGYNASFKRKKVMQKILQGVAILALLPLLSGCFLTKVVTVPMRVGGAIVSVVPVVGNTADEAIDAVADSVDELPF